MKCGLLGQKLGHSYSPQIHRLLGNYNYALYEKDPEQLEEFLRYGDFTGLNVTMPYKKEVIPYLDALSPTAQLLGAVNTIVRQNGKLIGHNTDYYGFRAMLQHCGVEVADRKCLVCGSGGASNTVVAVLKERGANVIILSRTGPNTYDTLYKHADAAVVVNCTPVGMYPNVAQSPIDLSQLPNLEAVLDVVYNPARTQLLLDAQERGLQTMNGLWMLVAQAKESAEWFTGTAIDDAKIAEIHAILRQQMENIVLIGMPGCGKSTIGRLLAQRLGKTFVDADEAIEAMAQKSIPQIFAEDGEGTFRILETLALQQLSKESGLVIATGGGCVTRQENYALLHQNGVIFWLVRDPEKLPTEGRPLSQKQNLTQMYAARAPLYKQFADHILDNNGSIDATLEAITLHFCTG